MKRVLVILLSSMMVLSLAACGGGDDTKTPSASVSSSSSEAEASAEPSSEASEEPAGEASTEPANDAVAAYEANMNEFIAQFETLSTNIGELMAGYDGSDEWYATFAKVYQALSDSTDSLAASAAQAPEEYQESHKKITFAVAAYGDMMASFSAAVDAYKAGDTAAGDELAANAKGLYQAAVQLWSESVESAG